MVTVAVTGTVVVVVVVVVVGGVVFVFVLFRRWCVVGVALGEGDGGRWVQV